MNSRTSRTLGYAAFFLALILTFIVILVVTRRDEQSMKFERPTVTANPNVTSIEIKGFGTIPYERLFEEVSLDGESLDVFIARISPQLRQFSDATGFEACGALASDGVRFGVIAGSNHGHTVCVSDPTLVPEGMRFTGETVHSHAATRMYQANATDLLVLGRGARLGKVFKRSEPDKFSAEDLAAPGYLIGRTNVWHQAGSARTIRSLQ